MGYLDDGGLGISSQGNWYPLPILDLPKPGHKLVIGDELDDPSGSSKKGEPKQFFVLGGYITSQVLFSAKDMV